MTQRVELDGGKYTVIRENDGRMHALRYGEPWRDLVGDNLIYWLMVEIAVLNGAVMKACGDDVEAAKATIESQRG